MGSLDLKELTIGYSAKGAKTYLEDLNTLAITETSSIIAREIVNINNAIKDGWQGKAADAFMKKVTQSGQQLEDNLKEMRTVFESVLKAQGETYRKQDLDYEKEIAESKVF